MDRKEEAYDGIKTDFVRKNDDVNLKYGIESTVSLINEDTKFINKSTAEIYNKISKTEDIKKFPFIKGIILFATIIIVELFDENFTTDATVVKTMAGITEGVPLTISNAFVFLTKVFSIIILGFVACSFLVDLAIYFILNYTKLSATNYQKHFLYDLLVNLRSEIIIMSSLFLATELFSWYSLDEDFFFRCEATLKGKTKVKVEDAIEQFYFGKGIYNSYILTKIINFSVMFYHIILKLPALAFIFTVKTFIIDTLQANIQNMRYYLKINENENKAQAIIKLNTLSGLPSNESISIICNRIVDDWGNHGDSLLDYSVVASQIGQEYANVLFRDADPSGDYKISIDELCEFYYDTIMERNNIINGLKHQSSSVETLNNILNLTFVGFAIYHLVSNVKNINENFTNYLLPIFSGAYVFSDPIKTFFESLSFICFKRPFEIGDLVIIDKTLYRVTSIYLLTTELVKDGLFITFSNTELNKMKITNVTNSKFYSENYKFKFEAERFLKSVDLLDRNLKMHSKRYSSLFMSPPKIKHYSIISSEIMEVEITCQFIYQNMSYEVLNDRKDSFVVALHNIFNEIGLQPLE